jgi:hypothetical protein
MPKFAKHKAIMGAATREKQMTSIRASTPCLAGLSILLSYVRGVIDDDSVEAISYR